MNKIVLVTSNFLSELQLEVSLEIKLTISKNPGGPWTHFESNTCHVNKISLEFVSCFTYSYLLSLCIVVFNSAESSSDDFIVKHLFEGATAIE